MKRKNLIYFWLTISVFCFGIGFWANSVKAENASTTDPAVTIFPNIIIKEVGFKDAKNDWVELYIINDNNSGRGTNIKGIKIFDDSAFLNVTNNLIAHTGDSILIKFNNLTENFLDQGNLTTFNIKKTGLTATTEQIILKNSSNEIIDAVCWVNDSPTATETLDFAEIAEKNQWTADIKSCVNSSEVATGEKIARKSLLDTNSKNDWEVPKTETVVNRTSTPEAEEEEDDDDDEVTSETDATKNTCENIFINEIFPNPKGPDTGNEWIELINPGEECVMDSWEIDDAEGGSKPFKIYNKKINNSGFLLLPSWETKIVLNNSNESVRLFNPAKQIVDEAAFKESAKEDTSFARNNKDEFVWTIKPTPLGNNIFESEESEQEEEDEEDSDTKTSSKTSTKSSAKKTTSKTVNNGDLSDKIHINELIPNPSGTDKGSEWIEIFNESEEEINLGGWQIDTGESATKNYIFDGISIKPNEYLVLSDTDLGISLKNTNGVLRLLDYKNTVIDSIKYESAAENSSYMRIKIIDGENEEIEWKWTENSSKGEENPVLYKYKGEILNYDRQKGELILKPEGSQETEIKILVENSGDELAEISFTKGSIISATVKKNENADLLLEDYEILSQADNNSTSEDSGFLYILLSSLPPAGFFGYMGLKKFGIIKF